MHAQVFIPCHLLVALSACGLWNIGRVREVLMAKMAGGALHAGVRTALDLRGLVVVAGGTVSLRLRQGHQRKGKPQHRQPQQHPGSTAHCNRHSQPPLFGSGTGNHDFRDGSLGKDRLYIQLPPLNQLFLTFLSLGLASLPASFALAKISWADMSRSASPLLS
jgi:hypothetical protein